MKKEMPSKKKRRKLRIGRVLTALFLLGLIIYLIVLLFKFPIQNVYVSGNISTTEQEIIDTIFASKYPSFITTTSSSIKDKLLDTYPIIKEVEVQKEFFGNVRINIIEHEVFFIYQDNYVLDTGKTLSTKEYSFTAPVLLVNDEDTLTDEIYQKFITNLNDVESSILDKVSEMLYFPNGDSAKERFLFLMNDGNYVRTTVAKLDKLNLYNDFKKISEGKKGILYLDTYRDDDPGLSFKFLDE